MFASYTAEYISSSALAIYVVEHTSHHNQAPRSPVTRLSTSLASAKLHARHLCGRAHLPPQLSSMIANYKVEYISLLNRALRWPFMRSSTPPAIAELHDLSLRCQVHLQPRPSSALSIYMVTYLTSAEHHACHVRGRAHLPPQLISTLTS